MNETRHKRIGLFGGTFDPIHFGHLRAAEEIRTILNLDTVRFIPSSSPPHKEDSSISPSEDRLRMIELAVEGNPNFEISTFELESSSPSYTIYTLEHFSKSEPEAEFYFIVGNELFDCIDSWRDYEKLFEISNFAVITRPGFSELETAKVPLALREKFRYHNNIDNVILYTNDRKEIYFIEIKGIEISSTDIRSFVKSKQSIKYLIPDKVEKYIYSKKLYSEEAQP